MSGEAVIVTSLANPAVGAGMLAAGATYLAVQAVQAHLEQRQAEARQRMHERAQELAQWQSFLAAQEATMADLNAAFEQAQAKLEGLRANPGNASAPEEQTLPVAQGFLASTPRARLLAKLQRTLAQWPEALLAHDRPTFTRLQAAVNRLAQALEQGDPPSLATLQNWEATLAHTLAAHQADLARQRDAVAERVARAQALLEDVLTYQQLALTSAQRQSLETLERQLLQALARDAVSVAELEGLSQQFTRLREPLDAALADQAIRTSIQHAVVQHLSDLGYRALHKDDQTASWEMPGGEQVHMAMQADYRLGFEVQHVREAARDAPLSAAELALLRRQEARWCADLKELLRRLNAEGYDYRVQFERDKPEAAIPIVTVEEGAAVAERLRQRAAPKARSFDA